MSDGIFAEDEVPEITNEQRAAWGRTALDAYLQATEGIQVDDYAPAALRTTVTDLVADVLHALHSIDPEATPENLEELVLQAMKHYETEVSQDTAEEEEARRYHGSEK